MSEVMNNQLEDINDRLTKVMQAQAFQLVVLRQILTCVIKLHTSEEQKRLTADFARERDATMRDLR